MPKPAATLEAWRSVAPSGRLVLLESAWGSAGGATERLRERVHVAAGKLRGDPPEHHADYAPDLLAALPYANNFTPDQLVELVRSSAWGRRASSVSETRAFDLRRLQEWMGHADITTTQRYSHFTPRDDDAALVAEASRSSPRAEGLLRDPLPEQLLAEERPPADHQERDPVASS